MSKFESSLNIAHQIWLIYYTLFQQILTTRGLDELYVIDMSQVSLVHIHKLCATLLLVTYGGHDTLNPREPAQGGTYIFNSV